MPSSSPQCVRCGDPLRFCVELVAPSGPLAPHLPTTICNARYCERCGHIDGSETRTCPLGRDGSPLAAKNSTEPQPQPAPLRYGKGRPPRNGPRCSPWRLAVLATRSPRHPLVRQPLDQPSRRLPNAAAFASSAAISLPVMVSRLGVRSRARDAGSSIRAIAATPSLVRACVAAIRSAMPTCASMSWSSASSGASDGMAAKRSSRAAKSAHSYRSRASARSSAGMRTGRSACGRRVSLSRACGIAVLLLLWWPKRHGAQAARLRGMNTRQESGRIAFRPCGPGHTRSAPRGSLRIPR
jgi:hypothetical protein